MGILDERHFGVVLPLGEIEGAVAEDRVGRGRPVAGMGFDDFGLGGEEDVIGQVVEHQRVLVGELQFEGGVVYDLDADVLGLALAVVEVFGVDDGEAEEGVGRGDVGIDDAQQSVAEVFGRQRRAVVPFEAVAEVERPGQAVFGDVPALGQPRFGLVLKGHAHQTFEEVVDDGGAVGGVVQRRIDRSRLDAEGVNEDLFRRARARAQGKRRGCRQNPTAFSHD